MRFLVDKVALEHIYFASFFSFLSLIVLSPNPSSSYITFFFRRKSGRSLGICKQINALSDLGKNRHTLREHCLHSAED